jgi:hypothetical protein
MDIYAVEEMDCVFCVSSSQLTTPLYVSERANCERNRSASSNRQKKEFARDC